MRHVLLLMLALGVSGAAFANPLVTISAAFTGAELGILEDNAVPGVPGDLGGGVGLLTSLASSAWLPGDEWATTASTYVLWSVPLLSTTVFTDPNGVLERTVYHFEQGFLWMALLLEKGNDASAIQFRANVSEVDVTVNEITGEVLADVILGRGRFVPAFGFPVSPEASLGVRGWTLGGSFQHTLQLEDVPGTPRRIAVGDANLAILVPEPAMIGLLILGAAGALARRRVI